MTIVLYIDARIVIILQSYKFDKLLAFLVSVYYVVNTINHEEV